MQTDTGLEKLTATIMRWSLIIIGILVLTNTGYNLLSNSDNDFNWWLLMLGFIIQVIGLLIHCWHHHPPLNNNHQKTAIKSQNIFDRLLLIIATTTTTLGILFYICNWRGYALSLTVTGMACCFLFRYHTPKQTTEE